MISYVASNSWRPCFSITMFHISFSRESSSGTLIFSYYKSVPVFENERLSIISFWLSSTSSSESSLSGSNSAWFWAASPNSWSKLISSSSSSLSGSLWFQLSEVSLASSSFFVHWCSFSACGYSILLAEDCFSGEPRTLSIMFVYLLNSSWSWSFQSFWSLYFSYLDAWYSS